MVTIPAGSASLGPASGEEEREGIPAASRQGKPRSPWQRGSNENTNGLVCQYFPRGTNFARISQAISMRLPCDSTNVRERPWAPKPQPINYKRCCTDRLNSHRKSDIDVGRGHARYGPQADLTAYSITSSARASIAAGIARFRALAVLELMMSLWPVDCATGMSAGLVPFRTLAIWMATLCTPQFSA